MSDDPLKRRYNLIRTVFGTPEGKELLEDLMKEVVLSKKINPHCTHETFFDLGRESIVVDFATTLEAEENKP